MEDVFAIKLQNISETLTQKITKKGWAMFVYLFHKNR